MITKVLLQVMKHYNLWGLESLPWIRCRTFLKKAYKRFDNNEINCFDLFLSVDYVVVITSEVHLNWLFFYGMCVNASLTPLTSSCFQLKTLNLNFHLMLLLSHWASRGNTVWSAMNHLPKAGSRLLSLLLNALGSFIFWFICIY